MRRILILLMMAFAIVFAFFPFHEVRSRTYQTSARTYPQNGRSVDLVRSPPEIAVRLGGMIPEASLVRWHRLSLGFPFHGALEFDTQTESRIVQGRIELIPFMVNLFGGLSFGVISSCLVFIGGRMTGKIPPPLARGTRPLP